MLKTGSDGQHPRATCDRCGEERELFRTGQRFVDPWDGRDREEWLCAKCAGLDGKGERHGEGS